MKIFADIAGALIRRNETQALLASSRERFRVLTATANDAIVTMDGGGLITHWNRAAERIFGYTESETVGRQVHEFLVPTRFQERAALGLKAFATSGKGGSLGKTVEMAAIRKDGIEIAIEISLAGTQLGGQWQAIAIMRDITERKQATAHALRMARYDVLTGLANRAVFVEDLQNAIAVAKRSGGGVAVIYLDLDHFKDINDTLGHPAGDELLKAVAARLRANTRETDTVARFGGDEFAVVVADTADPADAALLADKIIKAIADPFSVHGRDIHSGGSVGIAAYGADASDAETLLSHADVALYRAKSEGRGAYRFYTDAMDYEVQTRVKLGAELRTAIESDQLFLMYQPQISIDSGQITGVEALVRWRHPERGVLGADVFVPIAEEIGCIARLGRWVLWAACRQAKEWLDAGIAPKRVSVNVSALQFKTPGALADDIAEALAETGVPPTLLELELTESVLAYASREHGDALQRLRSTGITIAIDDFGTGYSSLEYLSRSPSNRIKIAQAFVKNLDTKTGDAAIVRATIALAHELGLNIVAEGVETAAQADLLRGWGCGEAQGFHFARPLSGEDATALLRTADLSAVSRLRLAQARATAATSHSHGRRRGFRKQHLPTRCAELAAVID
jgi:diguanylate cyclase (GGDEF)-like protein/PAS domain S-box-containing protein